MDLNRPESRIVERYAYCLCLHVKPATIFIGSIRLGESLLGAARYLVAVFYNGSDMKVPQMVAHQAAIPMYLVSASVSAMLLYGVTKSRPSYLMPFFWLRLCEFMFLLPTFISSLYEHPFHSSLYDTHQGFPSSFQKSFETRQTIWQAHGPPPVHKSLFFTTIVLIIQGYFLCVVWKCYRYLKVRELILPLHMPCSSGTDLVIPPGIVPPPATLNMSPPDYETATKGNGPPPPDYETAMKQHEPEKAAEETIATTAATVTTTAPTNASSNEQQITNSTETPMANSAQPADSSIEIQAGPSGSPGQIQDKISQENSAKLNEK